MKRFTRLFILGLCTWAVPFIISFFFVDKTSKVSIDLQLFKSIMIVIGCFTGALAIVQYFRKVSENYLQKGILAGAVWFIINILLDLLILVPMSGMGIQDYFFQIGIRYLMIPIICFLSGYLLNLKKMPAT